MFNTIIMFLIATVFVALISYFAWDSYQDFKDHESK
ncbi:hypothetical protein Mettu_2472 [Methylobacter tundripaludum SV96]|jgi:cytochrome c-type biogenesis protein CcmH/NrfG|uniref:Uncharacterized protein n=2 Tax=Methylobacter tundripaludum TaxID=173365 RepID=G3IRJ1_METTV|nr:hypothetical protein Mettu_2472 [Methylobacter tundripaludum SV96]PPK77837.1 hypothetical protein B0F87_101219 [Methylobacter tundripaludum]